MKPFIRVRNSIAYRSSGLYRRILERRPALKPVDKPELPLTFLTLGGAAHRLMLRECLVSLARAWPRLPRVVVVSDGSLDPAAARDLAGWPGAIEIRSWQEMTARLAEPRFADLVRFPER